MCYTSHHAQRGTWAKDTDRAPKVVGELPLALGWQGDRCSGTASGVGQCTVSDTRGLQTPLTT